MQGPEPHTPSQNFSAAQLGPKLEPKWLRKDVATVRTVGLGSVLRHCTNYGQSRVCHRLMTARHLQS